MLLTITLESVCAGGGHAHLSIQRDAGASRVVPFDADALRRPLTVDDLSTFAELVTRIRCAEITRAQARTLMASGISVTI